MSEPFVSVVTPVYNDDPYLEETIKSVLAQTHSDFEYVICNNHSTDRSGEIAQDYALKDSRVRVVSPPELFPQAKNFNFALGQIAPRSKYVKMISSDDWLFSECVAKMVALAEDAPSVGLVSSYRLIEATPDCFGVPVERRVFPGKEALRWQLLGIAYPFGTPSTVLYRADRVREALPFFFPEGGFYFDVDAAFRILSKWEFGFVHQILSFTRYQEGAIMDVASNLHTWPLMHFVLMHAYGRDVLEPAEFERHYAKVEDELYRNLGESWLKDRVRRKKKEELWEFQRKQLRSVGEDLRPNLIRKGALKTLVKFASNPGFLLSDLQQGLARKRGKSQKQ